jgi:hypothetical protein
MRIPSWLRYSAVICVTVASTVAAMYLLASQPLALARVKEVASFGKGVAVSQQLISEGKIDKANGLICVLVSVSYDRIVELNKIIDHGFFPKNAMTAISPEDRRKVDEELVKIAAADKRCKELK